MLGARLKTDASKVVKVHVLRDLRRGKRILFRAPKGNGTEKKAGKAFDVEVKANRGNESRQPRHNRSARHRAVHRRKTVVGS